MRVEWNYTIKTWYQWIPLSCNAIVLIETMFQQFVVDGESLQNRAKMTIYVSLWFYMYKYYLVLSTMENYQPNRIYSTHVHVQLSLSTSLEHRTYRQVQDVEQHRTIRDSISLPSCYYQWIHTVSKFGFRLWSNLIIPPLFPTESQ